MSTAELMGFSGFAGVKEAEATPVVPRTMEEVTKAPEHASAFAWSELDPDASGGAVDFVRSSLALAVEAGVPILINTTQRERVEVVAGRLAHERLDRMHEESLTRRKDRIEHRKKLSDGIQKLLSGEATLITAD